MRRDSPANDWLRPLLPDSRDEAFGTGQRGFQHLEAAADWFRGLRGGRVFVVADALASRASGAADRLAAITDTTRWEFFQDFSANPQWRDVQAGLQRFGTDSRWDAVLAVGGGTAIDLAKSICRLAPISDELAATGKFRIVERPSPIPLVVIPTTAGTGSEATQFAVLYVAGKKHSVDHPALLPDVVILDWTLTRSQPPRLTAATGLDALCQAIESIWSVRATAGTRPLSVAAIRLSLDHLETATRQPADRDRQAMMAAAHLAGRAIQVTRTTAPHALSYFLTSRYRIPHGIAVALCMSPCLHHLSQFENSRLPSATADSAVEGDTEHLTSGLKLICEAFGVNQVHEVAQRWTRLLRRLDCPTTLPEAIGPVTESVLQQMAAAVNAQRLANHPVHLSPTDLLQLLRGQQ